MTPWWQNDLLEVAKSLSSDVEKGLTLEQIKKSRETFGANELAAQKGPSAWSILFSQFEDFIVWILIVAALISGFLKEWVDAIAIIAIVILNAILGFVQEFRAEKSLAALKKLSSPNAKVIRGGQHEVVPTAELVPGDLVEIEAGDHVPADSRLVWLTSNFAVQEASLTGESTPVLKTNVALNEGKLPLADRANMVYLGTSVSSGKARAIVTEIGMQTELGQIAGMIQEIPKESTPLQVKLEEFGKWIVYLCGVLVGIVFVLGWLRGGKIIDVFLTSVSLAVAAIPEGLPAVVTVALALGVQRMVRRHALIRKLPSVETLGCATVICSDKTGTLTRNEMTVQAVYAGEKVFKVTGIGYAPTGDFLFDNKPVLVKDHPALTRALNVGVLCNGAELVVTEGSCKIVGDPTEGALLTLAEKAGVKKADLEKSQPFIDELPFDSQRKKMTVIRESAGKVNAYVKGAPDILLGDCKFIDKGEGIILLSDSDRKKILANNSLFADAALRVLAVAYRELTGGYQKGMTPEAIEQDLVFGGLVAMIDPPREEVKKAIAQCKTAGIGTVMITGDHKNTAVAIARDLGCFDESSLALTGEELDNLDENGLLEKLKRVRVYARVSPAHKLRVVRAWRKCGAVVAMTGDGVNDAPAVKEADIGVSMGITGTDVTKEVSDMVVTDDNFASIVAAVEEGRGIYENIKKFIHYLLSCNCGEILVMFISSLVGLPAPLLPIHILWVNLVTDGFPALALGVDPIDPNIMKYPPRPVNEAVVTKGRAIIMLAQGSFIAFCSLFAFIFVLYIEKEGLGRARTAAFIVLATSQLFHSFNCRSMTESIFKVGFFTNKKLVLAAGVSFLLQIMVAYVPFFQKVFKTESLTAFDWVLVIAVSSFPLWAMELVKLTNKMINKNKIAG